MLLLAAVFVWVGIAASAFATDMVWMTITLGAIYGNYVSKFSLLATNALEQ